MKLWNRAGRQCTRDTARAALERARELGISDFVVASNTGYTVEELLREKAEVWPESDLNIAAVTHHSGFREPGGDEMSPEMRDSLHERGVSILTATHLFANIERAVTSKWGGLYPGGIVSATLRMFGQGMKVCFEIAAMAKDAAMVPHDTEVMVLGGTGGGADTAVVMRPAHAKDFFDTELLEVICFPRGRGR